MVLVATQVKRRRGTTAENDAFTGAEGEITVDLGNKELRVHTGDNKVGGYGLARKDFENITDEAKNISNWSSNVSNCITNIPQDIKLELNNGTLTLKAGSKRYVPNGTGVFDEVVIENDMIIPVWGYNGSGLLSIDRDGGIWIATLNEQSSGSVAPTQTQYNLWYDTANDKIKATANYGSSWSDGWCLPIAKITSNGSSFTSIDQVFNGFGYVGSTVFVLSGLKCLIPNGRNADGSLKNTELAINNVQTLTPTASLTMEVGVILEPKTLQISYCGDPIYNEAENLTYDSTTKRPYCLIGKATLQASKITAFTLKTAFHAVDYNDTEYIAHQAMPNRKYISLTLGTSGSTYTAPADGYFVFRKVAGGPNQQVRMFVSGVIASSVISYAANNNLEVTMPVSKGQNCNIYYSATGATEQFAFVFANGAR